MNTKSWVKSKMVWVGVIEVLIGVLTAISGNLQIGTPLTVFGILQIILRVITTTSIRGEK